MPVGNPYPTVMAQNGVQPRPTLAQLWAYLEDVPDPEIPVLSVVDLGIVRELRWLDDDDPSHPELEPKLDPELLVAITPTYSGCPATAVIADDIETALRQHGVRKLRLEERIAPPWSTDWISAAGRAKLREYGIAPPVEYADSSARIARGRGTPRVACPRCESLNTDKISAFGSTPCKALYRCRDCLEPFDYFKCL